MADTLGLFSSPMQHMAFGAIAFVVTAAQAALSFILFVRMILHDRNSGRSLLISFFISGLGMQILWLLYLWGDGDLFVQIGLGLHIACSLIFLVQTMLHVRKTT